MFRPGIRVVFQGDSITDASRDRSAEDRVNDPVALGRGYANDAAAEVLLYTRGEATVLNRGISGNKVYELADRWDRDAIALKPDVLSILIGVNDYWHSVDFGYAGTARKYREDYDALLSRTRAALPATRLVVCEPFMVPCQVVNERWVAEFPEYQQVARELAEKHGTTWVGFQGVFNTAMRDGFSPQSLAEDGVHPTLAGHLLMARAWWSALA